MNAYSSLPWFLPWIFRTARMVHLSGVAVVEGHAPYSQTGGGNSRGAAQSLRNVGIRHEAEMYLGSTMLDGRSFDCSEDYAV